MKVSSKFFGVLAVLGLAVGVFQGCGSDKKAEDTATPTPTVSFSATVLPLVQANCTKSGCHDSTYAGTSKKTVLETEASFKASSGSKTQIAAGTMPQAGSTALTTAQKATFADFFAGK